MAKSKDAKPDTDKDANGFDGLAEGPEGDKPMSFFDHVGELRVRLLQSAVGITIAFFACFYFAAPLSDFLRIPLDAAWSSAGLGERAELQALQIQDPLMVDFRVSLMASVFVCTPWLFFQLWMFIAPGLYSKEKRFVIPFVVVSVIMFTIGAAFAFKIVLPFVYEWMITYSKDRGEIVQLELGNYFKGTTRVLLAFGAVFEFPLLVAFLAKAGVVTEQTLIRFWKFAVLLIFILATVLTPPEPISQLLMAVPMCVLYFISIGVAWVLNPAAKVAAKTAEIDAELGLDDDDD